MTDLMNAAPPEPPADQQPRSGDRSWPADQPAVPPRGDGQPRSRNRGNTSSL